MTVIDSIPASLDDDQVRLVRQLKLNLITKGKSGYPGWREMAWAVVDLCDLVLIGNEDARRRLTSLVRNGALAVPMEQLN